MDMELLAQKHKDIEQLNWLIERQKNMFGDLEAVAILEKLRYNLEKELKNAGK